MASPIGPYTPVVTAGDLIVVSGQLGLVDGVLADDVAAQTVAAIASLEARLLDVGATLEDVIKTTCFLTEMATFNEFNEAYVGGFGKHRPARTTVGVVGLPLGASVEIEALARREPRA